MTDSKRCKTCTHWKAPEDYNRAHEIVLPTNPVTYEPMSDEEIVRLHGYLVRQCTHPKVLFYERPARDGAAVVDGSNYFGVLVTAEEFGCVLHESK